MLRRTNPRRRTLPCIHQADGSEACVEPSIHALGAPDGAIYVLIPGFQRWPIELLMIIKLLDTSRVSERALITGPLARRFATTLAAAHKDAHRPHGHIRYPDTGVDW